MRLGIASDNGGFDLKQKLVAWLRETGHEITDFGAQQLTPTDDYPDFVVPLARAVASRQLERGIAVCGNGVGACVAANKVPGARACLIQDEFSAHQGVEDDDINIICFGARVMNEPTCLKLIQLFLAARFTGAERYVRRLGKINALEISAMSENPLIKLNSFGQSVWQDFVGRGMLAPGGEMQQLIEQDGITGVTSNPAIFEKAINGSQDYDNDIRQLAKEGKRVEEIYETLTVEDVARCADLFRGIYEKTEGRDGFASLEVSPHLANDTAATVAEARRLWRKLKHPNVLIKVPATSAGVPAIGKLISEGINVNVTLLFGLNRYEQVAEAYIAGLEQRVAADQRIDRMASVASFFLSRIDTLLDPQLATIVADGGPNAPLAKNLLGRIAIASAKQAYQIYKRLLSSERWSKLAARGAKPQRLLWASTSTKDKAHSDVMYVEPLIGPDTINTMTPATINAYRDHGNPAAGLENYVAKSAEDLKQLAQLGIHLAAATQKLENDGIRKFIEPYDKLIATLRTKIAVCKAGES